MIGAISRKLSMSRREKRVSFLSCTDCKTFHFLILSGLTPLFMISSLGSCAALEAHPCRYSAISTSSCSVILSVLGGTRPLMPSLSLSVLGNPRPLLKIGSLKRFLPFLRTISALRYSPPIIFDAIPLLCFSLQPPTELAAAAFLSRPLEREVWMVLTR